MSHRERPAPRGSPAPGVTVGLVGRISPPPANSPPNLLARLLTGSGLSELSPLALPEPFDDPADTDSRRRAVAALASQTPDIALVRSAP
ncbi:MAG TPA: hypothetical protein VH120_15520, partial [Gemmataceae bacterium]|nr:hypothetical protein [Gemmataceae bacterium]